MLINKLCFHREGGCTFQDGDEEWEGEGHCCNQTGSKWWSQRPRSKMDLSSWLVTDLIIWAVEFSELNNGNLVVAIASLAQRWTAYSFPQQFLYVGSQWLHSRATWIPMCVCQFFQTRTVRQGCCMVLLGGGAVENDSSWGGQKWILSHRKLFLSNAVYSFQLKHHEPKENPEYGS